MTMSRFIRLKLWTNG